jgi:hypothetical protein
MSSGELELHSLPDMLEGDGARAASRPLSRLHSAESPYIYRTYGRGMHQIPDRSSSQAPISAFPRGLHLTISLQGMIARITESALFESG